MVKVSASAPILRTKKPQIAIDLSAAMDRALQRPGLSKRWLVKRMLRCYFSQQQMSFAEFFRYGLDRQTLSDEDCRTFLNDRAMWRFNAFLNGKKSENHWAELMDKLATNARLEAAGLPVAQELARFHPETGTLKSAAEITAFLLDPDNTPLFGKPVHARSTLGVAAVEQSVGDGRVMLGDGRIVRAADLADEIAEHYREGYVFQELLRASDAMRPLSGPVVPTLRVATLMLGGEPVPLYALLRLPAVGAMADDGSAGENARAFLDLKTGAVVRAQNMSRVCGEDLHHAPVTGLAFKGQAVPQWDEVLRLSVEVHRQFPRHTFVGSDIALSSRGLVVNEANAQPHHMSYQMVSGRGILNAGFRPLFRQALAEKGITAPKRRVAWPYE